jgi:hypothetical protein
MAEELAEWQQAWRENIWRKVDYHPTPEQQAPHDWPGRLALVAGGEQAGKSLSGGMQLLRACAVPSALYWIVGPDYEQARAEFDYVLSGLSAAGVVRRLSHPATDSCSLTTAWGAQIVTKSALKPNKLGMRAPNGILMVEAAQHLYDSFLRLRGRIGPNLGWLWISGTFENSADWYADMYARWQGENSDEGKSFSVPTWSNLAKYPGGRNDPEIKRLEATYPPERFMERFGGVPCKPATLVFREFDHTIHVVSCPVDLTQPITLAIDPGYMPGFYAVLACQFVGRDINVCDEVYVQNMTHAQVIGECQRRPWWKAVKDGVIDVAGRAHPANESAVEVWRGLTGLSLRSQLVPIEAGIDRYHTILRDPATGKPRIWFDPRCKATIAEHGKYKRPEDAEGRAIHTMPIDRDNHSLKCLAYLAVDRFGFVDRAPRRQQEPQLTFKVRA